MLQDQFQLPRGLLGRFVGWLMQSDNEPLNRFAIELLEANSHDDVLEIGCGPGRAVQRVAERTPARRIIGIDPSDVMIAQAAELNRSHRDAARMLLVRGQVERLPFADGAFSKAFSVSGFHIWESRDGGLEELRRVLRPAGLLVVCLRRDAEHFHWFDRAPGTSKAQLDEDRARLAAHGFCDIRTITRRFRRRVVGLVARR